MRWFWSLFGWTYHESGWNTLWLRGRAHYQMPELMELLGKQGSVPLHLVINLREEK